ncbi:MAG: hypothetical protein U9Q68_05215 [Euryarchaeota archaeon]|nr:hypothetical protein [Euryarchaeota archaeon]
MRYIRPWQTKEDKKTGHSPGESPVAEGAIKPIVADTQRKRRRGRANSSCVFFAGL